MDESFINIALELFANYRKGCAAQVSDAVEGEAKPTSKATKDGAYQFY
ncbi:MAG: hypothetical protein WA667_08695 [Candidatus Nitrosopolaris sp.]